ncbi:integrase, catalytic region, zinc finger, CCHC-type containing protein [Tanacetum coccineum]
MSQAREAQIKLYKTHEDKELDKVIALENKVKVLNDIVYKIGQSIQTMNMLNRNCKTSFAKPEFLKKAQRANPRLYDIGCYNDNLALMLAPESDEIIRHDKESRSKLSDIIKLFDYDKLNNLYDLFVPQREKSPEQHYFLRCKEECKEKIKNDKSFKENQSKRISERTRTVLKFRLESSFQDKGIAIKSQNVIAPGMYKVQTQTSQTRTTQLPQDIRKTNKRVSFSTGVFPTTSVSRPQFKSNQLEDRLVEIILFIVNFGCSKHMMGNLKLLTNFVEKFLGTVKFGNDQIALILGYGDLVQGNITIKRVYYVEGLNHNLFSVGQFCDADLEVAFRKSTCYIRDLKGNDLLTGSRGTDLYSISLQDSTTPNPICLMAKATSSQAWLWHRRLSHLNFDTINLLSKNNIVNGLPKLKFVKDHLCSSCELGKAKRKGLHAQVTTVRTDKGTEFLNKTLHAYFAKEGIRHETSTARTPEQNGVVERRNRTLVEAARTMLSAAKVPLFFWAEAIAIACFTQNPSLIIPRHEKTPYHIVNAWKPPIKFFHIFGSLCYIVRDGENLDKMKEKGDACIFVGYSTQSKAYRVFNKRTRIIVETIHVNFDELPQMALDHVSSNPGPQCSTTILEQDSLSPSPQSQENVSQAAKTETTSNELELLYSPMFSELLNGTSPVVSKSFAVHAADNLDKRQQHNTTHSSTTTDNIIQAETNTENAQFDEDEFINIFSTPVQEQGETSYRHVDSSNMHTFYQHYPSEHRGAKDNPLEQVIRNPSQSIRIRRRLETDGEICKFALTVSRTEPKNIKEAINDSAWIEAMQEELH